MDLQSNPPALPSSRADWRRMGQAARLVLSIPRYMALAGGVTVLVLSLLVVGLNLWTVMPAVTLQLPLELRLRILHRLYPFVGTAFGRLEAALLVAAAVTLGVAAAMITHESVRQLAMDAQGDDAGFGWARCWFVVACAACASTLLVAILPVFGVVRPSVLLPMDGIEFTVPALIASLLSLHRVAGCMRLE